MRRRALGFITSTAVAVAMLVASPTAAQAATQTVSSLLGTIATSDASIGGYDRDLFEHWVDADRDGCDTRSEVLQLESQVPVSFSSACRVSTGRWHSPYDGVTWTAASDVDIDHFVPLAEAWRSGANTWSADERRAYANDLDFDASLVAVTDSVNQSKSDNDPANWLPALDRCGYVSQWIQVKYRWGLSVDSAERSAITSVLNGCGSLTVTVPPVARAAATVTFADVAPSTQFSTEIAWLASSGVSTGWTESGGSRTFRPVQPVARDAMAAFLYRLAGSPAWTPPTTSPFRDVATNNLFYREITWLANAGITTGWSESDGSRTFRPLEPVARDAMAAFMYRYAKNPSTTPLTSSPFRDVATSNMYYREISWLASSGISTGWDEGNGCRSYRPLDSVNRDAMAAFMYRLQNGATPAWFSGCGGSSGGGSAAPTNPGDTKNCGDFATYAAAKAWFDRYYPYYGDIARLDGNKDGVPCESLPGAP